METHEIIDAKTWNEFVVGLKANTFLQSWEWGQVQKRTGEDVRYVGFFENNVQQAAALIVIVNARRGKFLLVPHGPLFKPDVNSKSVLEDLIAYAKKLAQEVGAVALRVAPLLETNSENGAVFANAGFRPAPLHIHAELTWVLDISSREEEILAGMRKTTRHAVRKAKEVGVTAEIISNISGLDRFWPLYETTKDRHGFVPFSRNFLQAQAEEFLRHNQGYFVIASHAGKALAGALMVHVGNTVFYHHGASIKLPSSIPAAQYLHWASIQEAKKRGATRYNFWGIAPSSATAAAGKSDVPNPNHPFAGITTFKKGFGGYAIDYLHAQDLPLSLGYWKLWLVDSLRRWRRGF